MDPTDPCYYDFWQDLFRRHTFTIVDLAHVRSVCVVLRSIVDVCGRAVLVADRPAMEMAARRFSAGAAAVKFWKPKVATVVFRHRSANYDVVSPLLDGAPEHVRFEKCATPGANTRFISDAIVRLDLCSAAYEFDSPLPKLVELRVLGNSWDCITAFWFSPNLTQLVLGDRFTKNLRGVGALCSLRTLVIGNASNEKIDGLEMLRSLRTLSVGDAFNQELLGLEALSELRTLVIGDAFNKKLDALPRLTSLRQLSLGARFEHALPDLSGLAKLRGVRIGRRYDTPLPPLPSTLVTLELGLDFTQPVDARALPRALRSLAFGDRFNRELSCGDLPRGLRSLRFGLLYRRELSSEDLPRSLTELSVGAKVASRLDPSKLPPGLRVHAWNAPSSFPVAGLVRHGVATARGVNVRAERRI